MIRFRLRLTVHDFEAGETASYILYMSQILPDLGNPVHYRGMARWMKEHNIAGVPARVEWCGLYLFGLRVL